VEFVPPAEVPFDMGYAILPVKCPDESIHYFQPLEKIRQEIEVFFKGNEPLPEAKGDEVGDLPLVGTTLMHPAFAFGTINRCDFWNQRRPLIIHCGSWENPTYIRLRCLHDDYDYSSGMFFSAHWLGRALIGVNFATDYGDKHLSLHKVKDATIQAEDLRLRMEIGGNLDSLSLPQSWGNDNFILISVGGLQMGIKAGFAEFGDFEIKYETGKDDDKAWVDIVIYNGQQRPIDFREMDKAALGIALEVAEDVEGVSNFKDLKVDLENGCLTQKWISDGKELLLSIPVKPDRVGLLQKSPVAAIDSKGAEEFARSSLRD
jgi:hypothetical protein